MASDYTAHHDTPLGSITMASDGKVLVGLWFEGQKYYAETIGDSHEERPNLQIFEAARRWLDLYFSGRDPGFTPPLKMRGTPFQQRVWQMLLEIPYGTTVTYGDIARRTGCKSAQAVGGAVGHNAISIIIPCHRVIGTKGALTGYAGGIDRKLRLLQIEGAM